MTTTELILALRDWASMAYEGDADILNAAADRLEELDERVAIMQDGHQITMKELFKSPSPGDCVQFGDGSVV